MRLRRALLPSAILLTNLFPTIATATANATCAANVLGKLDCAATGEDIGPLSSSVTAGEDYVARATECGPRTKKFDDSLFVGKPDCRNALKWCPLAAGVPVDPTHEVVVYTINKTVDDTYARTDIACDVPTGPALPAIAAIKDEITKHAPIPRATAGGTTYLTGPAVVFTAQSSVGDLHDLTIPNFSLGGFTFTATLHLTKTVWSWGDGTADTYTADHGDTLIGPPYSSEHPCETLTTCSHYTAHSFANPGTFTTRLEAHWTGTFSVNGSPPVPIPGDIFATDLVGSTVMIRQAHSQLVAPR